MNAAFKIAMMTKGHPLFNKQRGQVMERLWAHLLANDEVNVGNPDENDPDDDDSGGDDNPDDDNED